MKYALLATPKFPLFKSFGAVSAKSRQHDGIFIWAHDFPISEICLCFSFVSYTIIYLMMRAFYYNMRLVYPLNNAHVITWVPALLALSRQNLRPSSFYVYKY